MEHPEFPEVTRRLLDVDASRSRLSPDIVEMTSTERIAAALETLATNPEYKDDYERFVSAMCYGSEIDIPTFESALDTVGRLGRLLS